MKKKYGPNSFRKIKNQSKILKITELSIILISLILVGIMIGQSNRGSHPKVTDIADQTEAPSTACDKATASEVSEILGLEVKRVGGVFPDRFKPTFISTCNYRSQYTPSRSVTIVVKDAKDGDSARKDFKNFADREGSIPIGGILDEATYSDSSNQIIARSGKTVYIVSISKPTQSSNMSSKEVAIAVMKELSN